MAWSKDQIIKIAHNYIQKVASEIQVEECFLFGSFAANESDEFSDIDLAIITTSLKNDNALTIIQKLYKLIQPGLDIDIEPHPFSPEEFYNAQPVDFAWIVKEKGIRIWPDK